jgi:hypothetical protein
MMRELAALGCPPFAPTDEQRFQVRVLAFNGVPHERIAEIMELRPIELVYHFRRELDLSEDVFLAQATAAIVELATQRNDLGIAFKANELMLRTRSSRWREPKEAVDSAPRLEDMSLTQVEAEIAKLEQRRRAAAEPAEPQAGVVDGEAVAH